MDRSINRSAHQLDPIYSRRNQNIMHRPHKHYISSNILKESFIGVSYKEGRTSTLIVYHENGTVKKTGKFVLSKSDGAWIVYFENGTIKQEKFYEKGEKKGVWKLYNEKGKVIEKTRYK